VHRPVPTSGHHNMGNRKFTKRQACVNTACAEDWSQHSDWSDSPALEFAPSCFRMALQAPLSSEMP
jgi:hypothetical protein